MPLHKASLGKLVPVQAGKIADPYSKGQERSADVKLTGSIRPVVCNQKQGIR